MRRADERTGCGAVPRRSRPAAAATRTREVEPPLPGGTHPKAQGPAKPHGHHPSRRERDHGLGGPEPDVPEPTPPPVNDPSDEGVNDEGDDVVVVPNR